MWNNIQAVGIDLGTTFSLVAGVQDDGTTQVLPLLSSSVFLPSTVTYDDSGEVWVGKHPAQSHYTSFKRHMHEPHVSLTGQNNATPFHLSTAVLKTMRARTSEIVGKDINQAVITVPAYFDDTARQATRQAAFCAGWNVLRLINEPTAAAYAYGLEGQPEKGLYMIYDWGGGTFDVSILELTAGIFQVRATCGDVALGGDDVDELIMMDQSLDRPNARLAKENGNIAHLESLAQPLMDRTLTLCEQALHDAKIEPAQLKGIVLVGGSSKLPFVATQLKTKFACPIWDELNPDTLVVQGAARQAHALTHASTDALLLDVNPLSLGVETMGGLTDALIPRNSLLPVARYQDFTTGADNQTAISMHVVQGESSMVSACRSLARFELTGLPPRPAGVARIRVTFELDVDGLLSVHAQDLETNAYTAVHVHPTYGLSESDWVHLTQGQDDHRRAEALAETQQTLQYIRQALKEDGDTLDSNEAAALLQAVDMLECEKDDLDLDALLERHAALSRMAQPLAERRMAKHMLNQPVNRWKETD